MSSYFPANPDDHSALTVIRRLQDWTTETITDDLGQFFRSLAHILAKVFNAQLVTIWDNNSYGECLVLQASLPERHSVLASHTIPTETSSTGLAIERRDFVFYPSILEPGDGRYFANPAIVKELHLSEMISVPVFSPTNQRAVCLVINFCFGSMNKARSPISKEDANRLLSRLGMTLQYHIYKRDEEINSNVRVFAASAKGIPSLFDGISDALSKTTQCTHAALFSWDEVKGIKLERSTDLQREKDQKTYPEEDLQPGERELIIATCVKNGEPLVLRSDKGASDQIAEAEAIAVQCPYMAVPILSSAGKVIGILRCKNPVGGQRKAPSFSSLDLHALRTFSRALAPSVERFVRLRQEGGMMEIVKNVSDSMVSAYQLDASLRRTIETLVEALHSEVGSIYLRQDGTDTFIMRAAKGSNEKLIGSAAYKVGEGITGAVATGQLLHFKSLAEMRNHPSYIGRYDKEIWGESPDHERETFLGVPITINDEVIGVWKISNVSPSKSHPDPYYTDEDIQIARVLSSLLAYAIQNYKYEERRLRQFTSLAKTSIQIQQANDEDEAVLSVMLALEDAGFAGALLSLYDAQTKQIVATQSAGSTWKQAVDKCKCQIDDDDDIRAIVLRTNDDVFISDSLHHMNCTADVSSRIRVQAQYVLPLRLEDEFIGTLQVDVGKRWELQEDEKLILKAFASHLTIAISRIRSIRQALELTNHVMSSSRFITAETLSGMAVHSLHHKLKDLNVQLKKELERQEIRQNEFLLKTLSQWNTNLRELETELKRVLKFVRAPAGGGGAVPHDLHPEIQVSINTWINYIRNHRCSVRPRLEANRSVCRIPVEAFREILAVLLVNAVQAHAKQIEIRTYNDEDVKTSTGNMIKTAFCMDCSDDGNGLATKETEEIFEATYTTKEANLGTGLGLFVARRLARMGGGDLEVVNNTKQAKGVIFRLTLPLTEARNNG